MHRKIAIDVDGVLARFDSAFAEAANKIWPGKVPAGWEPTEWGYHDVFKPEEIDQVWDKVRATQNFWLGLDAYTDNVGSLSRFLVTKSDLDVYFVTSREPTAGMTVAKQTDWWLRSCGIHPVNNYLGVIVVPDSNKKAGLYRTADIQFSIDDKTETVEQCDAMTGDHKAYLLDRPWNQDAKVKRRVKSLEDYLKEVV